VRKFCPVRQFVVNPQYGSGTITVCVYTRKSNINDQLGKKVINQNIKKAMSCRNL
jgi:hypothetical protein